jgi:ABC-type transporter Mla subunit MlaD
MKLASERYSELLRGADKFSQTADQLNRQLGSIEAQRDQIERSIKSLSDLVSAASNSMPQLERKFLEMSQNLSDGVRQGQRDILDAVRQASSSMQEGIGDSKRLLVDTIQAANREFNSQTEKTIEKTKEQFQLLDAALQEELTKSLNSLGRQLAALSQRFVEDYGPLTEKLRQVVSLGRGA